MNLPALLGGTLTVLLGVLGLVAPRRAAALVGLSPLGALGMAEVRATYGGLFIGLGAATLLLGDGARDAAGWAWAGAALARLLSLLAGGWREPKNLGGIVLEGGLAALLLWR